MKTNLTIACKLLVDTVIVLTFFAILNTRYRHDSLDDKKYLLETAPSVYFAGDSRAFWQLKPETGAEYLGLDRAKVVNIGRNAGHPVEVEHLIKENADKFREATVILSVSAFLANGNLKTPYHFSKDLIAERSLFGQIILFLPDNLITLQKYYNHLFMGLFRRQQVKSYSWTNGFMPLHTLIDYKKISSDNLGNDPWYKNFHLDSGRVAEVEKALAGIKGSCRKLVVVNAPFSQAFTDRLGGTRLYDAERAFDAEMKRVCARNNLMYLSYLGDHDIGDDFFADWAHLNERGAELFTRKVLADVFFR